MSSRDYQKDLREREPIVAALREIGIPLSEAARLTGWSVATINNDYRRIEQDRQLPPIDPDQVFPRAFQRLGELVVRERSTQLSSTDDQLYLLLYRWLHDPLKLALDALDGLSKQLGELATADPEQQGYANLARALFGYQNKVREQADWSLRALLVAVGREQRVPPRSRDEVLTHIVAQLAQIVRLQVPRLVSQAWITKADEAIAAVLDERHTQLVRLRFGLTGQPPMIQKEIGPTLGVQGSRISQMEVRALRKLRHPKTGLRPWWGE